MNYQRNIENQFIFKAILLDFTSENEEELKEHVKIANILRKLEKTYDIP